jgi:nitric oxide reductase subunit B
VVEKGLWFGRSAEFIDSNAFQTLTWMRIIGGSIFVLGGVVPLSWAIHSVARHFKKPVVPFKGTVKNEYVPEAIEL